MSDAFYTALRDGTAAPLIEKYGMALTLRRTTKGAYNENTGATGADTYTDYRCYAISGSYNSYMLANSLVKQNDQKLIMSPNGYALLAPTVPLKLVPVIGDQFIFSDGSVWTIPTEQGSLISQFQPIQPVAPGGIPVLFNVQIRR